ncbi:nitrite/sulfite reductase [Microbaculum sp. FT89]|uniref:nitrite/sulfite reductase n=1 Tax=Microbaculum sp. FT89 TaxID=3447298 RepID=UPI003F5370AA
MYRYDEFDHAFVRDRLEQFRDQVNRRLAGDLTEEQFKPLRLMNGVYLQLHAYMLRIAIPYGTLSARQLRKLAHVARTYDKGYGHFTTRQNLQFHWPSLKDIPTILEELAEVEMHAIQTSGNCIRNVTTDHFAGAAADEVADPRPWAEIVRQWSSLHPEFSFLPRKFKVAVTGAARDRAAIRVHDIGLELRRGPDGGIGFRVFVGGGLGRTPMVGREIRDFVPENALLAYLEAILRVYNRYGRRDNKFKARIKILVHERGIEEIRAGVEAEFETLRGGALDVPAEARERIAAYFAPPPFADLPARSAALEAAWKADPKFGRWIARNTHPHKVPGHVSVTISLKPVGGVPGDATAAQMDAVADLAERYGFDEIRVSHEQNLILPHVRKDDLCAIYDGLVAAGLATGNAGLATDIIACPGLDYCALANARSIPIAQRLSERFADADRQAEIGDLSLKISGCINACGHHHVGHIGILGVDRKGEEFYQITLGGAPGGEIFGAENGAGETGAGGTGGADAAIGQIVGKGFSADDVVDAVETIVDTYLTLREGREETFLAAWRRLGNTPFQEALYGGRS